MRPKLISCNALSLPRKPKYTWGFLYTHKIVKLCSEIVKGKPRNFTKKHTPEEINTPVQPKKRKYVYSNVTFLL